MCDPAAATLPDPSVPSTSGNLVCPLGDHPARISASQTPTPAVCILIKTSPLSTSGTGSLWSVSTSGPPKRSIAAACMISGTGEISLWRDRGLVFDAVVIRLIHCSFRAKYGVAAFVHILGVEAAVSMFRKLSIIVLLAAASVRPRTIVPIAPPLVVVETPIPVPGPAYVLTPGYHRWDGPAYVWVPVIWVAA